MNVTSPFWSALHDELTKISGAIIPLFVYGTLRAGQKNHKMLGDPLFLGIAWADGFKRVEVQGGPGIEPGEGRVEGELYAVDLNAMPEVDAFEAPEFRREKIKLHDGRSAYAYVAKRLEKEAEYAPGIPSKQVSPLPHVKEPETWEFSAHPHSAERAGHHIDMRLGNPRSGIAHSFVLPEAKLPEPGKAVRIMPTYDHTLEYMDRHSFEIPEGYGKGYVHKGRRTQAEVHHADPSTGEGTKLRFNLYDGNHPQEYSIRKDKGGWWLHNKTLTRERRPEIPESKPSYKEIQVGDVRHDGPEMIMPKLDGAHTVVHLEAGKIPRVFSYRVGKISETGLIEHTHKIPGLMQASVPKELDGTVLRAETIALDKDGKALPGEQIAGLLNSKVWESRAAQEEHSAKLKTFPFTVERFRGRDVSSYPFAEKLKILKKVEEHLPHFEVPEIASTPESKRKLLDDIRSGEHPLTREGVVLVHPDQVPAAFTKAKHAPDFDVYVRAVHPAKKEGGGTHDRAGAISYSWTPDGPIVGQLGGFKHDEARDMLQNPDKYIGRVAKVRAMKKFEAGSTALFQPRFKEWHLDKGEIEKLSTVTLNAFIDEVQKIGSEGALGMATELAGLGALAVPSIQHLRGKPMDEHAAHKYELGGLGILAAPYAYGLARKGLQGFKGLMGLRRLATGA